jgi:hypothetical protein
MPTCSVAGERSFAAIARVSNVERESGRSERFKIEHIAAYTKGCVETETGTSINTGAD